LNGDKMKSIWVNPKEKRNQEAIGDPQGSDEK
jgi:hypothetical protein